MGFKQSVPGVSVMNLMWWSAESRPSFSSVEKNNLYKEESIIVSIGTKKYTKMHGFNGNFIEKRKKMVEI